MLRSFYFLTLSVLLLSCQSDNGKSVNKPTVTIAHDTIADRLPKNANDREYWQKPEQVIAQLGDISDKTIADLGAGIGYFAFKLLPKAQKVIAIDVDTVKINILNSFKDLYESDLKDKLDIRLATAENPMLNDGEVDILFIVNTIAYIGNRSEYLKNLRSTFKPNGKIVIVDFKTKRIPDFVDAPPYSEREYLHVLEDELVEAGYTLENTDDTSLEYQFILVATIDR